jgi:hypothetical protein
MAATILNHHALEGTEELTREGLSDWAIGAACANVIGQSFHDGFMSIPDTLSHVYEIRPVETFLPQLALAQWQGGRLEASGRGPAGAIYYGLAGTPWGIARYSARGEIDEQDLINAPALDLILAGAREMGRAAKRTIQDLHGNYTDAGFSDTALNGAFEAMGKQTLSDDSGVPLHVNCQGRYLIVSPTIYGSALREAHRLWAGTSPIEVRSESRLSGLGLLHPKEETVVQAPPDSSWLVAAPNSAICCLVLGAGARLHG